LMDAFINVLQGQATSEERELVRQAFNDPHSELHDWIEQQVNYAEAQTGEKSSHTVAGDKLIAEAIARQHRDDVIAFFRLKREEGKLSEGELSKLIDAGAIDAGNLPSPHFDANQRATNKMLQLAIHLHPDLGPEIAGLTKARGAAGEDRGR